MKRPSVAISVGYFLPVLVRVQAAMGYIHHTLLPAEGNGCKAVLGWLQTQD